MPTSRIDGAVDATTCRGANETGQRLRRRCGVNDNVFGESEVMACRFLSH